MNKEAFIYSLMASGLGILIVFMILILLSGLMVLIRKFSDRKEASVKQAAAAAPQPSVQPAATENHDWLCAAVAAFLALEEDEQIVPQASGWAPDSSEKFNPWLNGNRLPKTSPGA